MTGWHVFRKESYQPCYIVVLAVFALSGGSLFARDANPSAGAARHEVISLTNLTPERGKEFLTRLKIGTVSKLPGTNKLLVTAEPSELQKAMTLLNLVDSRTEFDVKELGSASAKALPSSAQLANAVSGVCIGTFAHPPQDKTKMRAIVDVHNGAIVAIAPVSLLREIKLAVDLGPEVLKQGNAPTQPTKEVSGLGSPAASEPQPSTVAANFERVTADASPTIQAPALPDSGREKETQEPAVGPQTQRMSLSQSSITPEPTTPAEPQPTSTKPAEEKPNTPAAEPSQPVAESRSEETVAAKTAAPAAAESQPLQPGQPVPANPTPVTAAPSATPDPTTPVAASTTTPQTPATASAFRPADTADGDKLLDLTLPERMPVVYLLDLVGKHLGLSYVYNPDEVKGEVTLKLNGDLHGMVRVKDLYPLLEQTLRQNNLITTRHKGNVVSIAPVTRVMEVDPILIDRGVSRVESGDTAVTAKFELKYIDTAAAKTLLDSMKLGLEPVTALPEKHMLIVTTYAYRMERIERLLQMIDQPGEPKKFRFRQLRYTMAKTLADKVKAMAEQMLESVSVTVAEPDLTATTARAPGESDVAFRTRLAQIRNQQNVLRAQQAAQRAQLGQEPKPGVYLDADERTNRVLMIGAEKQLAIVEQLVEALDVQQQDLRALKLYRIKHVDAEDVARKLQELGVISRLPDSSTSSYSPYPRYPTTTGRLTPQLPGQPRSATPQTPELQGPPATEVTEKGLVEEPQVVVVEATNSLLVNATDEQHVKIARIVEFVDSETLTNEIPYKIYPLENSSPKHLSEVLTSLIQETVEQQKEGGKIEKVVVNKDEKIKIVPDPNTYSLIVYANKKNQEWISSLITQLDKRRPQVLIDVTLVAIQNHDKFDYDLRLLRSSPDIAGTSGLTGAATDKMLGKAVQTGAGGLTAFYGDKQVQALLDTVQEKTYGRVLAKPKLLVNDNEKGKIDAKDTTYVEVTSTMPVASGVPGTAAGVVQSSTSFQSYDAGVMLDITPHISEGDLLRLDIKLTRSDFTKVLATKPPDKKSSEVDTAVTLPNGTTVILGGLVKLNQSKGGTKVPLLGDIPLVGGLFRSVHNSEDGEYLYMFVKAEIIRPDEASGQGMKGLEDLSLRNRQAFEKRELEYQTYQDWPGIKSKRVEPSKVLDAQ